MFSAFNQYLIVPIESGLENDFTGRLREALELVAKESGYKTKITRFLKNKVGCSSNSVKHMLRTLPGRNTKDWSLADYPMKDAYKSIRKLDMTKYAKVINFIVSEYVKAGNSKDKVACTNRLLGILKKHNINPQSYQRSLCYDSIDGLEKVISYPKTANRVNNSTNAKKVADGILEELIQKEVII